jgi:glycosyltransferase involved in cell wall biosynthesis
MHLGGMLNNGITTSALCLHNTIDYERYDVSVTFNWSTHRERQRQIALIDPRARLLPRMGGINGSKVQVKALLSVSPRLADTRFGLTAGHRALLRDEWRRCFGDSEFDHVVDFSSYAPFWVKLLGSRPSGKFAIWFHNDMRAEVENAGRTKNIRQSVNGVLALCGLADRLVSVSAALDEVNREKLSRYAAPEKFTYARNTINFERIHHLATGVPARSERLTQHEDVPVEPVAHPDAELALPDAVQQLMNRYGAANIRDEVDRRVALSTVLPPAPGVRTFVTAGRLSTEKNHLRMIKAFGAVHEEDPATRLVLLGTGPLRARLTDAVESLGLASAVTLAGHQPNPYVIMANSDCFVLSSDYEGQPMVILEALVLGLPVVTTGFSSVRGALPEGYGKVVKLSVNALADGMRAFLRGEVPTLPFDDAAYNREATQEFYRAISAG